ncbi:MAG: type II toxin-antitoxin system HicA family toxin [Candidatus Zambryskibacteria bacterium]|nr:type II toxin-antitoxin system HicA family toxin [Candidatus Zambryskibacteria bacterium]
MSFLPIFRSRELVKVLIKAGFRIVRQVGSHVRLQHVADSTRQTSVPIHPGTLPKWLIRQILNQAKISAKELQRLLK